jgi:DNA-binding NarL/FixJ family response regulator
MAASVFITDDHYMVIEGIRSLLQHEKDIDWLGHASHAEGCMAFLRERQPDVLFMDINLPDKSGIELCKEVKDKYPAIQVIGLSSFNQRSYIQKMLQHGASGYVLKNADRAEIREAIETVMNGGRHISTEAAVLLENSEDPNIPVLTRREKEVLNLIADGMTNHEIADKLFISQTTVDTHRKNLLTKFEVKNTATLIRLAAQFLFI